MRANLHTERNTKFIQKYTCASDPPQLDGSCQWMYAGQNQVPKDMNSNTIHEQMFLDSGPFYRKRFTDVEFMH